MRAFISGIVLSHRQLSEEKTGLGCKGGPEKGILSARDGNCPKPNRDSGHAPPEWLDEPVPTREICFQSSLCKKYPFERRNGSRPSDRWWLRKRFISESCPPVVSPRPFATSHSSHRLLLGSFGSLFYAPLFIRCPWL